MTLLTKDEYAARNAVIYRQWFEGRLLIREIGALHNISSTRVRDIVMRIVRKNQWYFWRAIQVMNRRCRLGEGSPH